MIQNSPSLTKNSFLKSIFQIGKESIELQVTKFVWNKAVYTKPSVACGWAGAVMWWAGAVGGAVHMTASVACNWAGAVMQKLLAKCRKANAGQTDRPTNRQTDIVPYRVALQATKNDEKWRDSALQKFTAADYGRDKGWSRCPGTRKSRDFCRVLRDL